MENNAFQVGDLVQLKSGGPTMTVTNDSVSLSYKGTYCKWFSGSKLESGGFPAAALQKAAPKKGSSGEAAN